MYIAHIKIPKNDIREGMECMVPNDNQLFTIKRFHYRPNESETTVTMSLNPTLLRTQEDSSTLQLRLSRYT